MNVHIQKLKVVQTCSYSKCNVKLLKLEWFRWLVWHAASNVVNIPRVCQKPSLQSPGPHRVQAESFVRPSILISSSSYFTKLYRFVDLLSRLERKPGCKGHSLEMFLTYPMHQVIYCRNLKTLNWFTNPDLRFLATSSRCTSCWPTRPPTTWRRSHWRTRVRSSRTSAGRCTTKCRRQKT